MRNIGGQNSKQGTVLQYVTVRQAFNVKLLKKLMKYPTQNTFQYADGYCEQESCHTGHYLNLGAGSDSKYIGHES